MRRTSWSDMLADLDRAIAFCRSLRLERALTDSRFLEYRNRLSQLASSFASGGREEAHKTFGEDPGRNLIALSESAELSSLLPFFEACDRKILRRKLRDVLNGPYLPSEEDPNSNQARNILFELNLAAKLWTAGLAPKLGEHPDLSCVTDTAEIFIECKRPFSWPGGEAGLRNAEAQLRSQLPSARGGPHGVVALSVARLVIPGNQLFTFQDEASGRRAAKEVLSQIADRLELIWRSLDERIIGVIFHFSASAQDRSTGTLMLFQSTIGQALLEPDGRDHPAFRQMFEKLKPTWY